MENPFDIIDERLRKIEEQLQKILAIVSPVISEAEKKDYVYSLEELSNRLGCSVSTVAKLKRNGKIRYKQYGRKLIFKMSEVSEDIGKGKTSKE